MTANQLRHAALTPVLIVGGGRTGTTLLMQLLGTSRLVAFERIYPFEVRCLGYLTHRAYLLSEDSAGARTIEQMESPDRSPAGCPAYETAEFWNGQVSWKRNFPATWATFCDEISGQMIAQGGPCPDYYAEKVPYWMPAVMADAIGFRQLVSVRDPRDVFLSIAAFNQKRGFAAFGRLADDDDWTFARKFATRLKERFPIVRETCEADNSVVVRYEDLVRDISVAAAQLSLWLGVDFDPHPVLEATADAATHMTSANIAASVTRWKRELPDDLQEFFASELSEQLTYFAYEH